MFLLNMNIKLHIKQIAISVFVGVCVISFSGCSSFFIKDELSNQETRMPVVSEHTQKENQTSHITAISDANVGDIITFGKFEQDNNTDNGKEPIEWRVLDKQAGKILVISKYILEGEAYSYDDLATTNWSNCYLREWLNVDFLGSFSIKEKTMIIDSIISTEDIEDTVDKVFILSREEAYNYFNSDDDRKTELTKYAKSETFCSSWWLRSAGIGRDSQSSVRGDGYVESEPIGVMRLYYGVRPAMWLTVPSK